MHNHNPTLEASPVTEQSDGGAQPQPAHSMWWMVACCAPMFLIALALFLGLFGPR